MFVEAPKIHFTGRKNYQMTISSDQFFVITKLGLSEGWLELLKIHMTAEEVTNLSLSASKEAPRQGDSPTVYHPLLPYH